MSEKNLKFLSATLQKYFNSEENSVFIFGSRADGTAKKFSDFDIGVEGKKIPAKTFFEIKSEFEESDFIYTVDIVDFNDVSDKFRNIAKQKIISINLKTKVI